jgi:hypothetical protein
MAETLGSLCDKLTIVKLKQWHADDPEKLKSLALQERQLQEEISEYVAAASSGEIPLERLMFAANKVYKEQGNEVAEATGNLGGLFSQLADVNCRLWHVQERVYDFAAVPTVEKDSVIKQLALLNLERNKCIDALDRGFRSIIESQNPHASHPP